MNDHLRTHGRHMLVGGAAVATLLVVLGAGWQQAVSWGLLLACPLGMLGMMWFMARGRGDDQHGGQHGHQHGHQHQHPHQRVSAPPVAGSRPEA